MFNITEKECSRCKEVKPVAEFVSEVVEGLCRCCSVCRVQRAKERRAYVRSKREKVTAYHAAYVRSRREHIAEPGSLICTRCLREQEIEKFGINRNGDRFKYCADCRAYIASGRQRYRTDNPLKTREQADKALVRYHRFRRECLQHYGEECACCTESRYEFLALDHIGGTGAKHRLELGTVNICRWLIKNGFPTGFRTLCHNCNFATKDGKRCPHEIEREAQQLAMDSTYYEAEATDPATFAAVA